VLVRRAGGGWHQPEVSAYPSEAKLQKIIAESPSLLPEVEGPVAVAEEFPCDIGSVDIVGVDLRGHHRVRVQGSRLATPAFTPGPVAADRLPPASMKRDRDWGRRRALLA